MCWHVPQSGIKSILNLCRDRLKASWRVDDVVTDLVAAVVRAAFAREGTPMNDRVTTTGISRAPRGAGDDETSRLERRRTKLRDAKKAAAVAAADLAAIERRLGHSAHRNGLCQAGLRTALEQVAIITQRIKDAERRDGELREERKQARHRAAKMARHADAVEAKYDAAVLADMLRREKAHDLSDLAVGGKSSGSEARYGEVAETASMSVSAR